VGRGRTNLYDFSRRLECDGVDRAPAAERTSEAAEAAGEVLEVERGKELVRALVAEMAERRADRRPALLASFS